MDIRKYSRTDYVRLTDRIENYLYMADICHIKCAGLPKCDEIHNLDLCEFYARQGDKTGKVFKRLKSKRVKGGVVLYNYEFEIK